ncbi:MAG TPA: S9 family peptidase [Thermoanaerobaculia bacterium]
MARIFLVLLFLLAPVPGPAADLADIRTFLSDTSYDEVRVSPDGSRLAFLARRNDFEADREEVSLWLVPLGGPPESQKPSRLTTFPAGASGLQWSRDGRLLSWLAAGEGGATQVFVLDPAGGTPRRLTDLAEGVSVYDWLPDNSAVIVIASDPAAPATAAAQEKLRGFYGDVRRLPGAPFPKSSFYKVALKDGRVERIADFPFEFSWALSVSPDGQWLAAIGDSGTQLTKGNEVLVLPLGPQAVAPWQTRNFAWEESLTWAGRDLLVSASGEEVEGRLAVTENRLHRYENDGRLARIAPGLEGHVIQILGLDDGSLLATTLVSTRIRVYRVEPAAGRVQLLHELPGWAFSFSASGDGRRIAFVASDSRHFAEIHVADGPGGIAGARPVTDFNAAFNQGPLPEIEKVSWSNGEGDTVEGVLYWPPGKKGEKGLPLVVDVHGGPFGTARLEALALYGSSMSYPALLASRGFLVLNPNYRGSAGRGDEFTRAVQMHRCSRPATDVITGAENLIARGWADRNRVGLLGYSYGGHTGNCVITRSDLFRAACTGAGNWNDITFYSALPRGPGWAEVFFGGKAPWENQQLWWDESPISRTAQVKTPLLAVYGGVDGATASQSESLYNNLTRVGVPVEVLVFPGEGHIFQKPSHKLTKVRAEISWLEHYLLGKPRTELP